jgi:hypothetical protein
MAHALKYHTKVKRGGKVEITKVPLKAGTPLEVILIEENGTLNELAKASETSTKFWNNPIDDETWNDA